MNKKLLALTLVFVSTQLYAPSIAELKKSWSGFTDKVNDALYQVHLKISTPEKATQAYVNKLAKQEHKTGSDRLQNFIQKYEDTENPNNAHTNDSYILMINKKPIEVIKPQSLRLKEAIISNQKKDEIIKMQNAQIQKLQNVHQRATTKIDTLKDEHAKTVAQLRAQFEKKPDDHQLLANRLIADRADQDAIIEQVKIDAKTRAEENLKNRLTLRRKPSPATPTFPSLTEIVNSIKVQPKSDALD